LTLLFVSGCGGDEEATASKSAPPASIGGVQKPDRASSTDATHSVVSQPVIGQPDPASLHPVVVIETSLGDITVELDAEKAPLTVENFLSYVDSGHYQQTVFHQVFQDQGIVGGGFTAEMVEKETLNPVYSEADNGLKNTRGTIAMARQPDVIHSATCQFFLNVADNPELDHKGRTVEGFGYCVFGKVTEGMDVVSKIAATEVHDTERFDRVPVETVIIKKIRRF